MNTDVNNYYYIFKTYLRNRIEVEYKRSDFKINYTDIRTYNNEYSTFITVLLWLINSIYNDEKIYNEIKNFLESKILMDRLKGLKLSRKCIKLELM